MAERIGGNVVGKAFDLRDYDYKAHHRGCL